MLLLEMAFNLMESISSTAECTQCHTVVLLGQAKSLQLVPICHKTRCRVSWTAVLGGHAV